MIDNEADEKKEVESGSLGLERVVCGYLGQAHRELSNLYGS